MTPQRKGKDMSDEVKYVGGPLDGQARSKPDCRAVIVPDAAEQKAHVMPDGTIGYSFRNHVYEMKCYANGEERRWQLEYAGWE